MTAKDVHGLALSGASPAAAEHFDRAVETYHCFAGEPFRHLGPALGDSPAFAMAHLLKAHLTLVGTDPETRAIGLSAIETARSLDLNTREKGHFAAVEHLAAGEIRAAGRILEDVSIDYPRDTVALQAGQLVDFTTGDARMLRDRIGRVLPAWASDMPGWHAIQAMHAFGLEETGLYDRAEAAGREAVAVQPRNNWAQHAVAHVLEMQDRRTEGVRWMRQDAETWSHQSYFAIHNWWHLSLFHLGLGEIGEVLALYDGPIRGERSVMAFDLVDAAALLWRLKLLEIDVGDRWRELAEAYGGQPCGGAAFDDVHAVMAFVGADRLADADAVVTAMAAALEAPGDNAVFVRDVGLPVAQALRAYGRGDYAGSVDLLRDVRNRAGRFGGSHAQRDVLDLTLIDAARRAGETSLMRALLAERSAARPTAPAT